MTSQPVAAKLATITLNPAIDQTASIPNFRAGEVNRVEFEQADPGGKGVNVASFLADFGYPVAVSGFLGTENAEVFQRFFQHKQIDDRFLRIPGKTRVNVKIIDAIQQQVTDVNFPGQTATDADVQQLKQTVNQLAIDHDWFVLAGSVPAGISMDIYRDLIAQLKAQGKTVVLDASGASFRQAVQSAPDIIKPNIDELQELLGQRLDSQAAIVRAARDLLAHGIGCVAVSMGAQGAIFVEPQAVVWARPPRVEVKSTVGAGDAMVAGLITGKLRHLSLSDCARLATAFSIGALGQLGPRLPPPATVESLMAQVTVQDLTLS